MKRNYAVFCDFFEKLLSGELTREKAEEFVACRDKIKKRGPTGEKLAEILIKKSMHKAFVTEKN